MTKAASVARLSELHGKIAEAFINRLAQDDEDGIPTDAATLGAAIKFLKDNGISADPASADDLSELRERLAEQARQRAASRGSALELAKSDLKQMEG